jgi:hypothetical protein
MVAWKEAIETFKEALDQQSYGKKAELFEKAASLYEIAGDEDMIVLSQKYASAYQSLQKALEYLEEEDTTGAGEELKEAKPFFEELGEEELVFMLEQQIQASEEKNIAGFEVAVIFIFVLVVIVRAYMRRHQ